jgi:HK97 gp10 family phage protein
MSAISGGLSRITSRLEAIGESFTVEDLIPGGEVFLYHAQALCPVDTGYLRESGHLELLSDNVLIVFDAEYASYVEFGTSKMEAQPFLRPALDENQDEALQAIVEYIQAHTFSNKYTAGGVQTTRSPGGTLQP